MKVSFFEEKIPTHWFFFSCFIRTFNLKFCNMLSVVRILDISFCSQTFWLDWATQAFGFPHGKLKGSSKAKLICIFALGRLIFLQRGIKAMYSNRVYHVKGWLHCKQVGDRKAKVYEFSFKGDPLLSMQRRTTSIARSSQELYLEKNYYSCRLQLESQNLKV